MYIYILCIHFSIAKFLNNAASFALANITQFSSEKVKIFFSKSNLVLQISSSY